MPARPGRNRDQAIGALFQRLAGKDRIDHIMQDNAAIGMDCIIHLDARAERGDHHRNLVFHAHFDIVIEPVIGLVDDLVDRKRGRRAVRILRVIFGQFRRDPVQPFIQLGLGPGVQRREGSDHTGLALRDHQVGIGNNEKRAPDHRNSKLLQDGR